MNSMGHQKSRQRGISFIGLLFVAAVLGGLGLIGMQVLPTYIEYLAIQKAVNRAAGDGSTVAEIRSAFDRAAAVDDITSIKGADLDIAKQGDRVVIGFAYTREIELFGPAFLLMKYSGQNK